MKYCEMIDLKHGSDPFDQRREEVIRAEITAGAGWRGIVAISIARMFRRSAWLVLCGLAAALPLQAHGACSKEWKSWHDDVRGTYGILKISYQVCSRDEQNFKVYKNKDWEGKKNTFENLEEFTISPRKRTHSKTHEHYYDSVAGPIEVHYSVDADYEKGRVHSQGYVRYPNTGVFPIVRAEKRWNQFFYEIPASGNIIFTPGGKKDFVETSDLWAGFCSDLSCGPWVRFRDYSEAHRYNVKIPGVGPAIIQLWKGWCPRFNNVDATGAARKFLNIGEDFPGGLGAEVGIYVPKNPLPDDGSMMSAALTDTPLGKGEWKPLVNPNIRISFQLINTKTGEVVVDAPEKRTWWRTKWMSPEKYEEYKKSHAMPSNMLDYELRYTINGVAQPAWRYAGVEGNVTGVGRYPEIGFNGIWIQDEKLAQLVGAAELGMLGDFRVLELYHYGDRITVKVQEKTGWKADTLAVPLNGNAVKGTDKVRGPYSLSASQSGGAKGNLMLDYKYEKAAAFNRRYELVLKGNGDIHVVNTPVIFYPL